MLAFRMFLQKYNIYDETRSVSATSSVISSNKEKQAVSSEKEETVPCSQVRQMMNASRATCFI